MKLYSVTTTSMNLRCVFWGATVLVGIAAIGAAPDQRVEKNAVASRDSIYRIWEQREQKIRSASFGWKQTARTKWESFGQPPGKSPGKSDPNEPAPGQFIEVVQQCLLRLDDNRVDFHLDSVDGERFRKPIGYRTTFDGELSWNYSGTVKKTGNGSGAVVSAPNKFTDSIYMRPLLLFYRPTQIDLGTFDIRQAAVGAESHVIESYRCHLVTGPVDAAGLRRRYYVDIGDPYLIRRYEETVDDQPRIRVDINYTTETEVGWLPTKWKVTVFDGEGALKEDTVAELQTHNLHERFTVDDFRIDYRAGTLVEDSSNGKRRRLKLREANFIPASQGGGPPGDSGFSRRSIIAVNVLVLVAIIIWIAVRRFRRNRPNM
jgi:hypothetical protein